MLEGCPESARKGCNPSTEYPGVRVGVQSITSPRQGSIMDLTPTESSPSHYPDGLSNEPNSSTSFLIHPVPPLSGVNYGRGIVVEPTIIQGVAKLE